MSNFSSKPWWMVPANFNAPMELYIEEEQEEQIFGRGDMYLRSIEVHSHSLIQVESWFTAKGQTRVSVVGPHHARQWLMHMFWSLGHPDSSQKAQGLQMLQRVQNQQLTKNDFGTSVRMQPNTGDLSLASRFSGTVCLDVLPAASFPWSGCF
ncbi:KH homology domain-containing protein 1-like [Ochotona curzoniae]|uniref:KH homology domain-containing protein 1-like n=1 Tax=Ochotona curzoniae TaxID=130825 RepID=UPI001B35111E|nr:KH homology domain-containing protein 1-like [Ochotona curzoniae]